MVLVGAGNSAGQATVYLAQPGQEGVALGARAQTLSATMSRYLVDRISGLANVEVLTQTEISGLEGKDGMLEAIRWKDASGEETTPTRSGTSFCSSGSIPTPTGFPAPA